MAEIHMETLIIGAGPAGLACAMELSKHKKDFVVVERSPQVGGLSKTYKFMEEDGSVFYTDNGPHRFFSKNPYLYEFIGELLKDDWIKVKRQTRQYINGKFYDYPVNVVQALRNIGFNKSLHVVFDYLLAKISYSIFRKPILSFEDYAVAHFGRTLAEFNIINYTEKIWGIPASEIHPDWAGQRIRGLKFTTIIKNLFSHTFGISVNKNKSLIDIFYYPKKGAGEIYEVIKDRLLEQSYKILLDTWPLKISPSADGFKTELINSKGETVTIFSKYLVESVPIDEFINILQKPKPATVENALKNITYRSQVYLFVTLNKDSITKDQWIYFPDKSIPIGRVSEMKNFSEYMSPKGKTSIFIELFCLEGDKIWTMDKGELVQYIVPFCEKVGLFSKDEIRNTYVVHQKKCYPIYDLDYKKNLDMLKEHLNTVPGLFFIGRPGRFRYNNQDHSLEMGMLAAKSIIEGRIFDMESVDVDKNYQEEGQIPKK